MRQKQGVGKTKAGIRGEVPSEDPNLMPEAGKNSVHVSPRLIAETGNPDTKRKVIGYKEGGLGDLVLDGSRETDESKQNGGLPGVQSVT